MGLIMNSLHVGTMFLPWRWAGSSRMILSILKNPKAPGVVAMRKLFESKEFRDVIAGLASRPAMPPSMGEGLRKGARNLTPDFMVEGLKKLAATPAMQRVFAEVKDPNKIRWLKEQSKRALRGYTAAGRTSAQDERDNQ